jgi:hypothetical protein
LFEELWRFRTALEHSGASDEEIGRAMKSIGPLSTLLSIADLTDSVAKRLAAAGTRLLVDADLLGEAVGDPLAFASSWRPRWSPARRSRRRARRTRPSVGLGDLGVR